MIKWIKNLIRREAKEVIDYQEVLREARAAYEKASEALDKSDNNRSDINTWMVRMNEIAERLFAIVDYLDIEFAETTEPSRDFLSMRKKVKAHRIKHHVPEKERTTKQ